MESEILNEIYTEMIANAGETFKVVSCYRTLGKSSKPWRLQERVKNAA